MEDVAYWSFYDESIKHNKSNINYVRKNFIC